MQLFNKVFVGIYLKKRERIFIICQLHKFNIFNQRCFINQALFNGNYLMNFRQQVANFSRMSYDLLTLVSV